MNKFKILNVLVVLSFLLVIIGSLNSATLEVAHYTFNETSGTKVIDLVGDYNGTNTNVTINQPGKINKAYYSSGSKSKYINLRQNSGLNFTSDFSYSVWVKNDATWSSYDNMYYNIISNTSYSFVYSKGYGLNIYNSRTSDKIYYNPWISNDSTKTNIDASEYTYSNFPNTWQHIVVTHKKNGKMIVYQNNVAINNDDWITPTYASKHFYLFYTSNPGANDNPFKGYIDDLRIYDFVLDTNQISLIYNSGSGTEKPLDELQTPSYSVTFSSYSGLYWNTFDLNMSTDMPDANIFYTTDKTTPDENSTKYTAPISISKPITIKAIAWDGNTYTDVMDSNYSFRVFGGPSADKDTGTYYNDFNVTLSKYGTTTGTTLTYTLDGNTPDENSTVYTTPIPITKTTTLKFAEFKTDYNSSNLVTKTYTLKIGGYEPWDTTNLTFKADANIYHLDTGTGGAFHFGLYFKPDGTKLYVVNDKNATLHQYTLSTPWEISTQSLTKSKDLNIAVNHNIAGLAFNDTGTKMYTSNGIGVRTKTIDQYTLSTAWDISTATYDSNASILNSAISPGGLIFKPDGTKVYVSADTYTTNYIPALWEYTLSTPWDINTLSYTQDVNLPGLGAQRVHHTLFMSPDGLNLFVLGRKYTLSTPWDLNTISYDSGIQNGGYMDESVPPFGMGSILNILSYDGKYLYNYNEYDYTMDMPGPSEGHISQGYVGSASTKFSKDPGTYYNDFNLTLTPNAYTSDVNIFYTIDGNTPDVNSSLYSTPFLIDKATTVKAGLFKTGYTASQVSDANYSFAVYGTPTANRDSNTYYSTIYVALSKEGTTAGTKLTYTLNGTAPDENSTVYTTPIYIDSNKTLKFAEFKENYTPSEVVTRTYVIESVGSVTADKDSGTYYNDFAVTLQTDMVDADIYYTTDGSTPDNSKTLYYYPIDITEATTLKAIAWDGTNYTEVITRTYTMSISGNPTADKSTGTYPNSFTVTLSKAGTTTGTTLTYTLNGSNPNKNSTEYISPISITANTTLKFAEFKENYNSSSIITRTYTMSISGNPTANKMSGTYYNDFTVTLSKAGTTTGTKLTYTLNGSEPLVTSTEYSSPITISSTTTLKFREFKTGYESSDLITKNYTLEVYGTPTADKNSGTYNDSLAVKLSKEGTTTGTTLTYTLDGTTPTKDSTVYTGTINITTYNTNVTLKFAEFKTGYTPSDVITKTYFVSVIGLVYANKISATYFAPIDVVLTTDMIGDVNIFYTLNNTTPDENSTLYTSPIHIASDTNLQAIAYNGLDYSSVLFREYKITIPKLTIQFYDEQSLTKLDDEVYVTYQGNKFYADATGLWDYNLSTLGITDSAILTIKAPEYQERHLDAYFGLTQGDMNFLLLKEDVGLNITFLARALNNEVWSNAYVRFDQNGNVISQTKTTAEGYFTTYLLADGDYNAILYDANGTPTVTYNKVQVEVAVPKDEQTHNTISPFDISVGGLLTYNLIDQNSPVTFNIFAGTTSPYSLQVVDYNATPAERKYLPRTYSVLVPQGTGYVEIYHIQPYLLSEIDGINPTLFVFDKIKRPVENAIIEIYTNIAGIPTLIESVNTTSVGRASMSAYPLTTYTLKIYYRDKLEGTYTIQPRSSTDSFYFVLDLIDTGVQPPSIEINTNWAKTKHMVNLTTTDPAINVDVNVSSYNSSPTLSAYTISAYQNKILIDSENNTLSGTSTNLTNSFNKNLFKTSDGLITYKLTIDYNSGGHTYTHNSYFAMGVSDQSNTIIQQLQDLPNSIGRIWAIILAILITVSVLALITSTGLIHNPSAVTITGVLVLGVFVFLGWFDTGVVVLGTDIGRFIYVVAAIFGMFLMVKEGNK
jgi:hypothetical protein